MREASLLLERDRKSMGEYTATRRQATGSTGSDSIPIQFANKQTFACPLCLEVRVQVELGGHQVVWTMDVLPGMRVPIRLDQDQQLILIAHGQDLLVDSSGMDRTFPLQIREEALNQTEEMD
jgi:hypothetical protein